VERKAAIQKAADQEAAAAEREHAAKVEKRKAELAQFQVEATEEVEANSGSTRSAANRVLKAQQEQLDLLKATKDDRENKMMAFASKYGDLLAGEDGSLPAPLPKTLPKADPWESLGNPSELARDFVRPRLPPIPGSALPSLRDPNNLPSYPWGSSDLPAPGPLGLSQTPPPPTFSGLSPSNLSVIANIKKVTHRATLSTKRVKKAPPRAVVRVAKGVDGSRINTGLRKNKKGKPPTNSQAVPSGVTSDPAPGAIAPLGSDSVVLRMPAQLPKLGQLPNFSSSIVRQSSSEV